MLHFEKGRALVLGDDLRAMFADVDRAYLSSLRAASTIVETFEGAGLPASQAQKVHSKMLEGLAHIVEGRGDLVSVVGRLLVLKGQSDIAETDTGCPWPWQTTASSDQEPASAWAAA